MTPTQRRACRLAETAADPEAYERAHVAMRKAFPGIAAAYSPCEPGAWGSAERCLEHDGLPIGPDGRCMEGR